MPLLIRLDIVTTIEENWIRKTSFLPPDYQPSRWFLLPHSHCGGERQSPVNIETQKAMTDENLDAFNWTGFADKHAAKYITNTGHTGLILKLKYVN